MIDKPKKIAMFTIGLAVTCLCQGVLAQSEPEDVDKDQYIRIAVYDFTTVEVFNKYYQQQRIASPINLKSDPLLERKDISILPKEDRLALQQMEIMERIRKERAAEGIRLQRYNADLESRSKIQDAMLKDDFGRVILEGTQILEGELALHSDIFEIYSRKQGQEAFQQEINLQSSSDQNKSLSQGCTPNYSVSARVSDPRIEDTKILTEGSEINTRTTTMSVTITMQDLTTGRMVPLPPVYEAEEVQRVLGRDFSNKQKVYKSLLRKICKKASADIYKEFMTTVTVKVQAPRSERDLDMGYTDLSIEGEPQKIESIDDGEYKVTLRKGKTYNIIAENDDFIAEKKASFRSPRTLGMKLAPRYVTLKLKYKVLGDFDPDDAIVYLRSLEDPDDEEELGYGEGAFEEVERGQHYVVVTAEGFKEFKKKVSWHTGGKQLVTVRLKPATSAEEDDAL